MAELSTLRLGQTSADMQREIRTGLDTRHKCVQQWRRGVIVKEMESEKI